jgi:hypothetical protein
MYYYGQGGDINYIEAERFFRIAAEQGYSQSQYQLGAMYHQGQWVMRDLVKAAMWMNVAASNGNTSARLLQSDITSEMTQNQIDDAREMAIECRARGFSNC